MDRYTKYKLTKQAYTKIHLHFAKHAYTNAIGLLLTTFTPAPMPTPAPASKSIDPQHHELSQPLDPTQTQDQPERERERERERKTYTHLIEDAIPLLHDVLPHSGMKLPLSLMIIDQYLAQRNSQSIRSKSINDNQDHQEDKVWIIVGVYMAEDRITTTSKGAGTGIRTMGMDKLIQGLMVRIGENIKVQMQMIKAKRGGGVMNPWQGPITLTVETRALPKLSVFKVSEYKMLEEGSIGSGAQGLSQGPNQQQSICKVFTATEQEEEQVEMAMCKVLMDYAAIGACSDFEDHCVDPAKDWIQGVEFKALPSVLK